MVESGKKLERPIINLRLPPGNYYNRILHELAEAEGINPTDLLKHLIMEEYRRKTNVIIYRSSHSG